MFDFIRVGIWGKWSVVCLLKLNLMGLKSVSTQFNSAYVHGVVAEKKSCCTSVDFKCLIFDMCIYITCKIEESLKY